MSTPPCCADCAHCVAAELLPGLNAYIFAKCAIAPRVDPLSGAADLFYCSTQRTGWLETDCGPHGKFFEAAEITA